MKNIIFDLDGTLVESLPGIEESARVAITRVLPEFAMPDLRPLIGPPIAMIFARLWPELAPERMLRLLAEFRTHYDETGCLRSEPYPGVPEVLSRLQAAGLRLFVLTNKPLVPARKILTHLGLVNYFTEVLAPDSMQPPFDSKIAGAKFLKQNFGLSPGSTMLVGDGGDDAEAAEACGFGFVAAAYGYGRAAAKTGDSIEKFSEIEHHLL